jgi:predicted transcriptional regulator
MVNPLEIMPAEHLKHETLILTIVQEYLNQNKFFNMKKIVFFIESKLKTTPVDLNIRGIEEILRALVKKKLLVEGTRLSQPDILNNKVRKQIYQFVIKNPGAYYNKIVKGLKINKPVVVWHINMLSKFGFIRREKFENHDIFFDSRVDKESKKLSFYTSKDQSRKIIEYLKVNDHGITKTHLSTDLGMHHNTVSKYLEILEDFNIVVKKKNYKKTLYFINEEILETLNLNI